MEAHQRFEIAKAVQDHYANFVDFCYDGLKFLGFESTRMQLQIALTLYESSNKEMIQAPRGEGKSMITALYTIWNLIQDPTTIVMIVAGYVAKAEEIASIIYQIIHGWDILEYLRPDTRNKDLNSVSKFDVHRSLKGFNQSPSVSCVSVFSSMVGKRAGLLVADDVETVDNAMTPAQRDKLERLTGEFSSIVTHGKVLYLGTPQTKDSIYNRLPAKGYKITVFTARYPTKENMEKYGDRLARYIREDIEKHGATLQTGGGISKKMGKPVDPMRYTEEDLIKKEEEQGAELFELQFMLNTDLADALRQQLKLSDLIVANFSPDRLPEKLDWACIQQNQARFPTAFGVPDAIMYHPIIPQCEWVDRDPNLTWAFVDPAGGGGDELAWSIATSQAPYIHWLDTKGLRGGFIQVNSDAMIDSFIKWKVTRVRVETNMGHGLFEINLKKCIAERISDYEKSIKKDRSLFNELQPKIDILKRIAIESEFSKGQKERRIIDSLVTMMQRHQLVVHQTVFESDAECNMEYGLSEKRYSAFYQMENITTDRNSLFKDDRLETVAGVCRMFKEALLVDADKASEKRREEALREFMNDPTGRGITKPRAKVTTRTRGRNRRR